MNGLRRFSLALILAIFEGTVALGVAWPIQAVVRASYGSNLDGDAPLWNAGGLELLDLIAHGRAAWSPLMVNTVLLLATGALIGVAPTALVIRSLGDLEHGAWRSFRARLAASVSSWGTLLVLWIAFAVSAVLLVLGARFFGEIVAAIADGSGDVRAQQTGWIAGGIILLLFLPLIVLHDLAQVVVVIDDRRFFRSIYLACGTFRRRAGSVAFAWAWRAIAGLAFVAVGAFIASRLGGQGGSALLLLAVAHQIVVVARASLRIDWLGSVVRETEPIVHETKLQPPVA